MHEIKHALPYCPPPDEANCLVFADEHLIIANKPAGLLAVPGRGADKQDCLISRIQRSFPDALVVHRLDMETSGLMVLARGTDMQRRLSALFEQRLTEKHYEALVSGQPQPESGDIAQPLRCDWPNRPRQIVDPVAGKFSLTRYRTLASHASGTRLALQPITGRSHQLRVHLLSIGHPIVGDRLYGGAEAPRLMLHATRLAFAHPARGEQVEFALPAPF